MKTIDNFDARKGFLCSMCTYFFFLNEAGKSILDTLKGKLSRTFFLIEEQNCMTSLSGNLGNSCAHNTSANDKDGLIFKLQLHLSRLNNEPNDILNAYKKRSMI